MAGVSQQSQNIVVSLCLNSLRVVALDAFKMTSYLHQVVVRSIELLIKLDHQALEERGELLLLLARLEKQCLTDE